MARKGFSATVDDIAAQAGLSARTVFRHYSCRDALIVDAVRAMFEACGERPIAGLPTPHDDLDGWIDGLARTIHTRNAEIIGRAFWDIHAPAMAERYPEIREFREQNRVRGVHHLVNLAWDAAGGAGPAPESLAWVVGLQFSVFTTQALMIDFDLEPQEIGVLTAGIVKTALRRALGRGTNAVRPPAVESGATLVTASRTWFAHRAGQPVPSPPPG